MEGHVEAYEQLTQNFSQRTRPRPWWEDDITMGIKDLFNAHCKMGLESIWLKVGSSGGVF
jgi:hypothetical protein